MSAVLAPQGSAEWLHQRGGKLTASRAADAFRKLKSGAWAATRRVYMIELLAERLTGLATDHYLSREMLFGIEHEPDAIAAYEFDHDCTVQPGVFVEHPTISNMGATPDGFVGDDGIVEMKNPKTTTFLEVVLSGQPDPDHLAQAMFQLACAPSRKWCDLRYHDVRLPLNVCNFEIRVHREPAIIAAIEAQAREFLSELDALESRFKTAPKSAQAEETT